MQRRIHAGDVGRRPSDLLIGCLVYWKSRLTNYHRLYTNHREIAQQIDYEHEIFNSEIGKRPLWLKCWGGRTIHKISGYSWNMQRPSHACRCYPAIAETILFGLD
jgi:hypothetical protein